MSSKYNYVSYTKPSVTTTIDGLVEATRYWEPIEGRVVEEFDYWGFVAQYGLERPASPVNVGGTAQQILATMNLDEYRRGPAGNVYAAGLPFRDPEPPAWTRFYAAGH
jgi:hypothetical protein